MLDVMVPCLPTTFAKKRRVADDRYVARALVQLRSAGGQAIAVYYSGVGGVRGDDGPTPSLPFTTFLQRRFWGANIKMTYMAYP